jgi:hypothetical protein
MHPPEARRRGRGRRDLHRRRPTPSGRIRENVEKGSAVYSDSLHSYSGLDDEYVLAVVDHAETYVEGQVHVSGVEKPLELLKRGLHGTYVSVQPWHLFRHIDERVFTHDERGLIDLAASSWCWARWPGGARPTRR